MKYSSIILSSSKTDLFSLDKEKTSGSEILTAKVNIYVPSSAIVLLDQATEQEKRIVNTACRLKGGLIV